MAAACFCVAGIGMAQDPQAPQGGDKPKPAAKSYGPIGSGDEDQNPPPDTLQPDNRPLTGFQEPTLGTQMERHSYWVPGVSYYNYAQSNGSSQGGSSDWNSTSYLSGNVSLLENWSRSSLALNYSGGGDFSTDSTIGNGWFQQLSAVQTFNWQRWQLTLLDEFAYLPQAQFGFGAGTGLANPGIGGTLGVPSTGLAGQFLSGQTIFTAIGPRYTNTGGAQATFALTPRSSVTIGGLASLLRFSQAGNIESNDYVGNIGYNYQLTRADTIGVLYRFSSFHYLGFPQAIGDHTVQLAYGRKITGRLALQVSGGPEITEFRIPQSTTNNKTQYISGSGNATLSYAFSRSNVSVSYLHGVTAGSGVFIGATTDQVTFSGSRKLTRKWSGNANIGFAHNSAIGSGIGTVQTGANTSYDTVYAGASLARQLGRNANFTLGYTAYIENANSTVCAGTNCASNFTSHQISVGLSWHTRPLVLR